jgi:hypothetical protein
VRSVIDQECLFDSILATSIPYKLKPYYLHLFYQAYVQRLKDMDNIDINNPRVLDLVKFIMLLDLENYFLFYGGLCSKLTDDMEPELVENAKKVKIDLEKQSQDIQNRI